MTEVLEQNGQQSAVAGGSAQVTWEAAQAAAPPETQQAAPAGATLESALITFQTGNDNKEPASIIEVVVRNRRNEMVALPVFPSRVFRHGFITVNRKAVKTPKDLEGKRIGVPLYTQTAALFVRGLLKDEGAPCWPLC